MKMRKGFTLVELLIVIVIIGILAAAMLLSSGSASDAAKAAAAVSEMRAIKAAVIMHVANAGGNVANNSITIQTVSADMEKPTEIVNKYTVDGPAVGTGIVTIKSKLTGGALEKLMKSPAVENDGSMQFKVLSTN